VGHVRNRQSSEGDWANVRTFRKRAGLSQKKLAEKADLHPVYISHVERGTKTVSVEALWKLSWTLRVRMASLVRGA
jgi:transcriptional regulator with XRE-family HTH domain